jgi:hypothetical protein
MLNLLKHLPGILFDAAIQLVLMLARLFGLK